jgi:hypothetical protein
MKMLRMFLLVLVGVIAINSEVMAGGSKNSGTLTVTNNAAGQVGVVVDPPAAWAAWTAPLTPAQEAQVANRATLINTTATQSFKLKRGAHVVLAFNVTTKNYTLTNVIVYKKAVTGINVNP